MKSIIKHNHGLTELLLIFPLFIGILFAVGGIGFFMIQKTKMEKDAWQIQTRKTYRMSDVTREINPNYTSEPNRSVLDWGRIGSQVIQRLPIDFASFIATHAQKHENLVLDGQNGELTYHIKAEMISSGDPMRDATLTQKAMWAQAMREAGFSYYSLKNVGFNELTGIPIGYIQDAWDILKNKTESK